MGSGDREEDKADRKTPLKGVPYDDGLPPNTLDWRAPESNVCENTEAPHDCMSTPDLMKAKARLDEAQLREASQADDLLRATTACLLSR